ncbi:MAG: hypothetical protein A2020_09060 [Lentisphaerae bacterium GWF2_45_14]|nr:MAG: hypothetical protein A2020_09060 [Lentisphaerae bacterium GWF2_45_14]
MSALVCISGMNKGSEYTIPQKGEIKLGRSEKNDVCVFDKKSSRFHCVILVNGESFAIQDLESTNGLKVNDEPVKGTKKICIGDRIMIGQTVFIITEKESTVPAEPGGPADKKYENLIKKTSFQATKTTNLRRVKMKDSASGTGFLSFFEPDGEDQEKK